MCIDDATRLAYSEILPDERKETAVGFLERALGWLARQGVTVERVMTDNGSAYLSKAFRAAIAAAGLKHRAPRDFSVVPQQPAGDRVTPVTVFAELQFPALCRMGGSMASILIRFPAGELSEKMAAMRKWLDERRSEPSGFTCDRYRSIFVVCVDFSNDGEAEAFKSRFSPPEVTSSSSTLVNGSSISSARPKPETMARVSWWRLMAEEVRTDADEMSCASAKEMMGSVAATYDRLAENLERQLVNRSDGDNSIPGQPGSPQIGAARARALRGRPMNTWGTSRGTPQG